MQDTELKKETGNRSSAPFCTCTDLKCPNHPSGHSEGCTRCIRKCLALREIPSCFFHSIDAEKTTKDWFYADFTALVEKEKGVRSFRFTESIADAAEIRVSGEWIGEDLSVAVSGGDRPHIGCIALGIPDRREEDPDGSHASVSVLNVPDHRDDFLAVPIARKLSAGLGCRVTVSCGVHVDSIRPEQIERILETAERIAERVLAESRSI